MRSRSGTSASSPGPRTGRSRPTRNTTARSYSRITRTLAASATPSTITATAAAIAISITCPPSCGSATPTGCAGGRPSAPVVTTRSPWDARPPGSWRGARGSRARAQRPASAAATSSAPSSAASAASWLRTRADEQHEPRQHDEQERQAAVEAAGLGVRPRVHGADDLAPLVGVGAVRPCAGSRCRCAPWRGSARGGARGRTRAATGARPRGSASGRAARRSRTRPSGSAATAGGSAPRATPGAPAAISRNAPYPAASSASRLIRASSPRSPRPRRSPRRPSGSWISVNRMSSGSSSVTLRTVWRIPR